MNLGAFAESLVPLVQRKYLPMMLVGLFTFSSGLAFRVWQADARASRRASSEALLSLLNTRSEPRRDIEQVGVMSLALASGVIEREFSCLSSSNSVCREMKKALREALNTRLTTRDEPIRQCSGTDAYEWALDRHSRCEELERLDTHIFIPADSVPHAPSDEEVHRVREVAHGFARVKLGADGDVNDPMITSLFYVTSNGFFAERSLFPDSAGDHPESTVRWHRDPGHLRGSGARGARVRLEAGSGYQLRDRSYVEHFRQELRQQGSPTFYQSEPYIDLAGGGMVRTFCLYDGEGILADSRFFGVVCADYALPVRTDAENSYGGVLDLGVAVNAGGQVTLISGDRDAPAIASGLRRLARRRGTVEEQIVQENGIALVKIRRQPGVTWWLILGPSPHGVDYWFVAFIVSSLFFSLSTIAIIVLRTLRDKEEVELAMLRNLQVGVVQVRGDQVVGANDRAEELLGRQLPSLDEPRAGPRFCEVYSELREKIVVSEKVVGHRSITETEIEARRALGESFSYLAMVKAHGRERWLEIWGTPFLDGTRAVSSQRTFAVLRPTQAPSSAGRDVRDGVSDSTEPDGWNS